MRNRTYYSIVRSIRHQQHGGLVLTRTSSSVSSTCQETEAVDDHNFDHNLDRTTSKIKIPFGFVTPKPKPLRVADGNYKGAFKAVLAAGLRLGSGIFTVGWRPIASTVGPWPGTLGFLRDGTSVIGECARPVRPLILWDNEADPRCRIVREACSMLDLETEMRPQVGINAGPALQDGTIRLENTREIVDHLFKNCK